MKKIDTAILSKLPQSVHLFFWMNGEWSKGRKTNKNEKRSHLDLQQSKDDKL